MKRNAYHSTNSRWVSEKKSNDHRLQRSGGKDAQAVVVVGKAASDTSMCLCTQPHLHIGTPALLCLREEAS